MSENQQLLLKSGGYRNLKSFQLAQLCFDITVRFVELYIPKNSRTVDQMVQAAQDQVFRILPKVRSRRQPANALN